MDSQTKRPIKTLVTGAAGFIGSHLCERLLAQGCTVTGIDNFDDFYDPRIKRRNLATCLDNANFSLVEADIRDADAMNATVARTNPDVIVHLAAKAGVRPSIEQPLIYADVNVNGTTVLLQAAAKNKVHKFIFASSSSIYGNNKKVPFSEDDNVDFPISPYAATKKAGELICHTFHHLYAIDVTCLRFFTVYGPRQRPDLAIHKFASLIESGKPIPIYGDGSMMRDFTYIDDIIDGTLAAINQLLTSHPSLERSGNPASSDGPRLSRVRPGFRRAESREATSHEIRDTSHCFAIYNLGNAHPLSVNDLVTEIETALGKKAIRQYLPPQPGDVVRTYADITKAARDLGYQPKTDIRIGLAKFAAWLRQHK
jgi:UDP-glucuronate 4-epimerase